MNKLLAIIFALFCATAQAATYHFCDCQAGSTTGCIAGSTNPTLPTTTSTPFSTLAAWSALYNKAVGDSYLFCEGGKWLNDSTVGVYVAGVTAANPTTVASYTPTSFSSRKTSTVTMTTASPTVVTWTAHTLAANNTVKFTSTGVLPTGIEANVLYYVVPGSVAADVFKLSRYRGDANSAGTIQDPCVYLPAAVGCNVAVTGAGSGTLTAIAYERPWLEKAGVQNVTSFEDAGLYVNDGGFIMQDLHLSGGALLPPSAPISTLTGTGTTTGTIVTTIAHGLTTGKFVTVFEASIGAFNNVTSTSITVTNATTFTYTCAAACTGSPTNAGYTVDQTKPGGAGFYMSNKQDVFIQRMEIHNVDYCMQVAQSPESPVIPTKNLRVTIRDSYFHHCAAASILGGSFDLLYENNLLDRNGSALVFDHDLYLSSGSGFARFNTITRSTMDGKGRCNASPIEVHGEVEALNITDNKLILTGAMGGCYGIEMDPGYDDTPAPYSPFGERFLRSVIARNQIVCAGYFGIAVMGVRDMTIENNVIVWPSDTCGGVGPTGQMGVAFIVTSGGGGYSPMDDRNARITIRNNSGYNGTTNAGASAKKGLDMRNEGTGHVIANNVFYWAAASPTDVRCFYFNALPLASLALINNNLCFNAAASIIYSDISAALWASRPGGYDTNGLSADPLFVAAPSDANGYSLNIQATSPAIGAGNTTSRSALQYGNLTPGNVDTLGAYKRGSAQAPAAPGRVVVQ